MSSTKRAVWIFAMTIFLIMTTGCGSVKTRTMGQELNRKGTGLKERSGQRVAGYTLSDGSYHEFDGKAVMAGTDSLFFYANDHKNVEFDTAHYTGDHRYAVGDVDKLYVVHHNTAATIGTTILVILGVMMIVAAIALATKESCPFLYSHDGEQFVFDGEPYGGATMTSLQRTDYSELEHMRATDGEYRLLIRNEVDETQHTDALGLVVADHPAESMAVMDYEGKVHCFPELTNLSAAYDEKGNDLLVWLSEQDKASWYPDLEAYAAPDSLLDTRNHITLEFPRPAGLDRVHLVSNVGTGQWGSHMIRVMLGMRGNRVEEFYEAINSNPEYQRQLAEWNAREDLFTLDVEVQVGDKWVPRGELHGGGPFLSENRALPLDLSGIEGDVVRVRMHPPISFWQFDAFHLGFAEVPATVREATTATAVDDQGNDILGVLASEDGIYFDQPTGDEWAELTFTAPEPLVGLDRTIFAVTSGWYGIHLYSDGPPDTLGLQRLTFESGYAVRRAMSEFREFQETGRLGYIKPTVVAP